MEVEDPAAIEEPGLKREVYYDYIKLKRSYEFGCLLMLGLLLLTLPLLEAIQQDMTVFESEAAIQDKIQANISEKEVISPWSPVFCWSLEESQLVLVYAEEPLKRVLATFEPYNTTSQLRWNAQSSIGWNPRRGVHLYQSILQTGTTPIFLYSIKEMLAYLVTYRHLGPNIFPTVCKLQSARSFFLPPSSLSFSPFFHSFLSFFSCFYVFSCWYSVAMLTGGVGYLNYAFVEQNQWFLLMPCSAWIGQPPKKNLGAWVYIYVVFWVYFILYIVLYIRIHAFRDVLRQTEYVLEAGIVKLRRREEEHAPLLQ